jgi:hypothetical protein
LQPTPELNTAINSSTVERSEVPSVFLVPLLRQAHERSLAPHQQGAYRQACRQWVARLMPTDMGLNGET